MGGGYLREGTLLDVDTLHNAVREMERIIWVPDELG